MPHSKFLFVRLSAWTEILIFFLIMLLIAFLSGTPINFFTISPHPFWIIVLLISTQYGTVEGLLAAVIATCFFLIGPLPPPNILEDPFERFFFLSKTPILWFITAVVLGELRLKQLREMAALKEQAVLDQEKEKSIATAYNSLKAVKERLEIQVAAELPPALIAIGDFRKISQHKKEEMVQGALHLIQTLFRPEQCSIYFLEGNELKYAGNSGWKKRAEYSETLSESSSLFQEIVQHKREVSIRTGDPLILGKEGLLAVPIVTPDSKVVGMIKIEEIPFHKLNIELLEALKELGKWIGLEYKTDAS